MAGIHEKMIKFATWEGDNRANPNLTPKNKNQPPRESPRREAPLSEFAVVACAKRSLMQIRRNPCFAGEHREASPLPQSPSRYEAGTASPMRNPALTDLSPARWGSR